ncbi:EAL domain-containing protein, partial [bacterium]|nr:EAL domain-containing protein [bacterium]
AAWRRDGLPDLRMAVNMSAVQFRRGDVAETVIRALERSGLPARCLELELTESILLEGTESVMKTIGVLKALGVQLSIDDFGTGYSCLSYLKRLDVGDQGAIVKAIIQMGRTLQLTIVAEGVETHEQLSYLADHGCHEMQGYLFSRPVTAEDFRAVLRRKARPFAMLERERSAAAGVVTISPLLE